MKRRVIVILVELYCLIMAGSAARAQTESVLYSFCSVSVNGICEDGQDPEAGVIVGSDGNFYGITTFGGAGASGGFYGETGSGTAFKLTPSGTLTTLYSFCSQENTDGYCTDGEFPVAPLIQASDGNFYGTTWGGSTGVYGSPYSYGTVFRITPSGTLTTVYAFCSQSGCTDGADPNAGLIQGSDGNLYGTTLNGGANLEGTIFKITPSGTLTTLYSFCNKNGCADGANPLAPLIQVSEGSFYGTTFSGGTNGITGTIFKITPSGTLTTLYPFTCRDRDSDGFCLDGENPFAGVTQATNGNFYGTTEHGGTWGHGNVFKMTPSGTVTPLCSKTSYSGNCTDGSNPSGLIQASDGNLYGTTAEFGALNGGNIFELAPSGTPKILYSFCSRGGCADGNGPIGGVIQARDGNLYGTTVIGGTYGGGTVFELSDLPTTVSVSPTKLDFGKIDANVASKTKKVTLNNKGDELAMIGQLAAPASFTISSDTCSNTTLASKEKCTIEIAFAPAIPIGSVSETLSIPYNGSSSIETLTGNGLAVTLSAPKSKALASTAVGSISRAENVTIKNESETTVVLGSPAALAGFDIASDSCAGATLASKDNCLVSVEFVPPIDASGTVIGTLSYDYTYGANRGSVVVALTGKVKN